MDALDFLKLVTSVAVPLGSLQAYLYKRQDKRLDEQDRKIEALTEKLNSNELKMSVIIATIETELKYISNTTAEIKAKVDKLVK